MATCDACGGLGRVAAAGMTCHTGVFWTPAASPVRDCLLCHGTGAAAEFEPARRPLPAPRRDTETAHRTGGSLRVATRTRRELGRLLAGEWIVEVHGDLRLLAVLRFRLITTAGSGRFDARCDFGGAPGWQANGAWATLDSGDTVHFAGIQSSPHLIATGYRWGATLRELSSDVLHGESLADEPTLWRRTEGLMR